MNECPIAATVPDANRQQLAYVYYENEPGRRSAAKLLTKDEARRIATNGAKLPVLMDRTKTEPQARRSGLFRVLALRDYRLVCSSTKHHRVVIIVRSTQIRCTRHHTYWVDGGTSKRAGGSPFSHANPSAYAN